MREAGHDPDVNLEGYSSFPPREENKPEKEI